MTNLRDALEKAGITAGDQANDDNGGLVDELKQLVDGGKLESNNPAFFDQNRPKLVENEDELTSVVGQIEKLVSQTPDESFDEQSVNEQTEHAESTAPVEEEMRSAAELTDDAPPPNSIANLDDIPMLNTDQISADEAVEGGFSEDIKSIDDSAETAAEDVLNQATTPGEFDSYDPLGIDEPGSALAENDYEQQASESGDWEPFEHSIESVTIDEEAADDLSEALDSDSQSETSETAEPADADSQSAPAAAIYPDTDTEGFNPGMIPGMKPGSTFSVVTTDESKVPDPLAAANEITGEYVPQDLNEFNQYEGQSAEQQEYVPPTPQPSFLQTTNLQTDVEPRVAPETHSEPETYAEPQTHAPAEPDTPPDYIAPAATAATTAAAAVAAAGASVAVAPDQQPVVVSVLEPLVAPGLAEPQSPAAAATSVPGLKDSTEFEQHILENLTKAPLLDEYETLANNIIKPDLGVSPRTICFLSAEDSSFSAEIVAHLGVVFSMIRNKKVLMVDANGCPDNITRSFRRDKQPGLKNITSITDDWLDMALPTVIPDLFVLPGGWNRGTKHWEAGGFGGLLPLFSRQFDLTLVDGGVAERTEDTPFYAACDRVLMLVRLGQTERNMASAVRNGLKSANVPLDGCVITNVPA